MSLDYREEFLNRRKKFLDKKYSSSLKQILSYIWEYKKLFISIIIFGIVQSILFLTLPLFLSPALDILVDPNKNISAVFPIFVLIIIIQSIVAVLFTIRIYLNRWVGSKVIFSLRNDLFLTIQLMSFKWLDENKSGELISRTTSDLNNLKQFLANNLQFFVRQSFTFVFSYIILFIINAQLAFYVVLVSPFLFYALLTFRKKMRPVYKKSRETYADLTHRIQENVQGIKVVKSFAREEYETDLFKNYNDEYYEDSMDIIKLQATFDPVIYLLDNIAFLVVLLVGGLFVIDGVMTFGALFAFVLVMNFSIEPLYFITRFLGNMPQITETSKRLTNILNSEIIVKEKQDAKELPPIKGEIEFKNVSFSFSSKSDYYVLKDINLKVKPGETIAILGATGSGKSALVKLIPRFYDADKGEILIDGTNIKDVTFNSLRKQIGFVSQERHLFSRSIRDNIAFGNRDIPFNDVKYAARVSNIDEFIEQELPKEYQTKVGERGTTLSGGQKQRVAIARAFAIKPKILILDDATSAVDVDTEYEIQQHFEEVFEETTTFLITHRLSSVRHADRILILDNGKIAQLGTHEELINQDGIYKKLYQTLKMEEQI